ncbi:MAG: DUF6492 family protein [Lachnospiraceae bacterium]|nr:DUF6492 family protein [Lachnospiraceae bacterium]
MDKELYDAYIVTTASDMERVKPLQDRMIRYLPVRYVYFVGSEEVGKLIEKEAEEGDIGEEALKKVRFLDENEILPFEEAACVMEECMQELLNGDPIPRGAVGWYYQQFLKYLIAYRTDNEYYLVWDGDTVPCKEFSMFSENGIPYLDTKHEFHEMYFEELGRLIPGMQKIFEQSFVAEHMLFKTDIVKKLISKIEANDDIKGRSFWEKIFYSLSAYELNGTAFSEYETYGTYIAYTDMFAYRMREWHSFRYGAMFFDINKISESDLEWLGHDFFAISFEKNQVPREDTRGIFDNPEYQKKLSAKQILLIAQREFDEGALKEKWD